MSDACKVRRQCAKCPWKTSTNPRDIPNGYSEKRHRALSRTIADPGSLRGSGGQAMACHEFAKGAEQPCVGWLNHQLGPGNNIALRLQALSGRVPKFEVVGPQHARFEATLPAPGKSSRGAR